MDSLEAQVDKTKEPEYGDLDTEIEVEKKMEISFKKPSLLVGKRGRLPKRISSELKSSEPQSSEPSTRIADHESPSHSEDISAEQKTDLPQNSSPAREPEVEDIKSPVFSYKEPDWSGLPDRSAKPYVLEVLKNGSIIETIDLMKKPFWVFGRLANCDIAMQHPTISRYHAVLQFRDIPSESEPPGFYIYDLGSTHGTFLNGKNNKLKPKMYAPLRVGHMIRLGCSQRSYILTGPDDDQEEESELSVTELKQLRAQKIKEHEEKMRLAELEREEKRKKEEERGVDWGMGDDAEEEEDIKENPYASTTNEELYLDDPKKALRGFFEREGLDLEYDCSEQGMGQFLCKVELPLDDEMGRPVVAEVLHKGKKKEAVVQCALEACRMLDRAGILRQATHESRKRKARDWEENDYYDSDEDTFLDRTGTIEKKREKRMKVKQPEKAETYESLLEKEKRLSDSIADIEKKLNQGSSKSEEGSSTNTAMEEDSLDSYMKGLTENRVDKQAVSKLRLELANLKKEHASVVKLINIVKPASLPMLNPTPNSSTSVGNLPIFGKRRLVPVKFPAKPSTQGEAGASTAAITQSNSEEVEEEDSDDADITHESTNESENGANEVTMSEVPAVPVETVAGSEAVSEPIANQDSTVTSSDPGSARDDIPESYFQMMGDFKPINAFHETESFKQFQKIMNADLPEIAEVHKQNLMKILKKLQRMATNEDRAHCDWRVLSAKTRKMLTWMSRLRQTRDEKLHHKVTTELGRILNELKEMTEDKFKMVGQLKQMGKALENIYMEIQKDIKELEKNLQAKKDEVELRSKESTSDQEEQQPCCSKDCVDISQDDEDESTDEKKKKKNQKRIEQRQHKAEIEKQKGYEEDSRKEDYNMWVPPSDQSGDGKTKLNERYGY